MSEEKINVSDLTEALARRTNLTKKSAESFVSALQDLFQSVLLEEKLLKIAGLGTFRLQWVEPRRSVNVQTGEAIEIAGHNKVVFTPDATLKEQINEPYAHLLTTLMDGQPVSKEITKDAPLKKLADQAVEIQDILSSINDQTTVEEDKPEVISYEQLETMPSIEPATEPNPFIDEPIPTPESPINIAPPTIEIQRPMLDTILKNASAVAPPVKRKLTWLWITLVALVLLGGGSSAYYFYGNSINVWVTDTYQRVFKQSPQPIVEPQVVVPVMVEETQVDTVSVFAKPRVYDEFIGEESISEGGRLTLLSEKYYGCRDFWVYIYEANKAVIANPNRLEVGTKVRIPKLDPKLIDLDNPETLLYARQLHDQYVELR